MKFNFLENTFKKISGQTGSSQEKPQAASENSPIDLNQNGTSQELSHKVINKEGHIEQEIFENGDVTSLSEEMLTQEKLDTINMQLISETDPVKRVKLEAQVQELEEKLGLETEHQLAA